MLELGKRVGQRTRFKVAGGADALETGTNTFSGRRDSTGFEADWTTIESDTVQ
jgi:hypothetical protein